MGSNKFLVKNPIITEKAHDLSSLGKYIFLVEQKANAPEVKKAIEGIYKVNVIGVNLIRVKPKRRRFRQRVSFKPGYTKAIVTLKKGQKLDVLPH